jgi:Kef-type K+ transport system membrane component KefB
MSDLLNSPYVAWSIAIALAWLAGELCVKYTGIPRISVYGLVGFLLANTQSNLIPNSSCEDKLLLANIAFGLILFELGYRINLRWLRNNPWIGVSGLFESIGTFLLIYFIAHGHGISKITALLLGALAMSTSPAGVLLVVNEQRSSGQVTERILHLSAINCVLAVFLFKIILGYFLFKSSGNLWEATSISLFILIVSAAIGGLFGIIIPAILRALNNFEINTTVAFALAIILLVAITHSAKLSPVLATLTFGIIVRHRRISFSETQRNFGVLGELLTVLLFVFVVSILEWEKVVAGLQLGLILIGARLAFQTFGVALFARLSGVTWFKGMLSGLGLAPISVFVILVLEQERYLTITFVDALAALTAMTLFMEVLGPIITQRALVWADETPKTREG